jgi:hypothetical protein
MKNKEFYEKINPILPIFMQTWWLDALCQNWGVCINIDKEDKIDGAMVYQVKKKYGLTFSLPLPLSPVQGIWFRYPPQAQKLHTKYSFEMKITQNLIAQLPLLTLYITQLGVDFQNWLPFHWKGFKQKTRFTYIIDNLQDIDAVFSNFNTNVKRNIKKGADLTVVESENIGELYDLAKGSVERGNGALNFSKATLNKLYIAIKKKHAGQIYSIQSADNQILASVLIVWDAQKAYFLLAGDNKENSSATTCLVWDILQKMNRKGIEKFDFEGSMLQHIEAFYRSFGAKQTPYHLIYKAKNRFWELLFNLFLLK